MIFNGSLDFNFIDSLLELFFKSDCFLFGVDLFIQFLEVPLLELFLNELLLLLAEFTLLKLFVCQKFPLVLRVMIVADGHEDVE